MARIEECILYRDFEHGEILKQITFLIDRYELTGEKEFEEEKDIFYKSEKGQRHTCACRWPAKTVLYRAVFLLFFELHCWEKQNITNRSAIG